MQKFTFDPRATIIHSSVRSLYFSAMSFKNMKFIVVCLMVLSFAGISCTQNTPPANNAAPAAISKSGESPTESYKLLYAAVKSKDTAAIKSHMSQATQEFAEAIASKQNTPIEKVFENGFTATTFSEVLPELRDERISGNNGALEVYNSKESKWEDLPFTKDEGGWKLAIGDLFRGTWESPGKGRSFKEQEAANAMGKGPQQMPVNADPKMNSATNSAPPQPRR